MVYPDGRLRIHWEIEHSDGEEARLVLEWVETGVPSPDGRSRGQGYGSRLLERALPYALGGEVDYALTEQGVRCVFRLPTSKVVGGASDS